MEKSVLGLRPGSIIQDSYRITKLLGEGGMGATFAGQNIATSHDVAIKVITPEFARNSQAADLFRREANLLRTVQSDAVVRYETCMMDKSGQLYLVMEYISGKPLSHYLGRGARLASADVLRLGRRVADGLAAIHRLGIVHRDISPDNIIVPDDDIGGAKLIDFGVASDTIGTDKSIIGDTFAGKISFAAPEQLGLHGAKVSRASDAYALGLVLVKTVGLEVPGTGRNLAVAIDARRDDLTLSDPRISPALRDTLEALLKSDPAARPEDLVGLFDAAIARQKKHDEDKARNEPSPESAKAMKKVPPRVDLEADQPGKSSTLPIVLGVFVVAALAAGGGWYLTMGPGSAPTGEAMDQAETAREALSGNDPLAEIEALISTGGEQNLNSAFGALMAFSRDEENAQTDRQRAALMIARMYDPETFDSSTSPFPAANPNAARRFYQEALDLGAEAARAPLNRLTQ